MFANYSIIAFAPQPIPMNQYYFCDGALNDVINQFCWGCELPVSPACEMVSSVSPTDRKSTIEDLSNYCEQDSYSPSKIQTNRRRRKKLPEISKNLKMFLEMVDSAPNVSFKATTKSSRGLHNGHSSRRSRYIGVLGNGKRWQVLLNMGKKKKYIGTYTYEEEAALVHDFYSIGLNGLCAKTNFSYDRAALKDMISSYFENGQVFKPSRFISRI